MGTLAGEGIDNWLRAGGLVVTSSERGSRAFQAAFHRRRRAEGLAAWAAPNILDWNSFARTAWEERNIDGRLLLNSAQEQALWSEIIHSEQHLPTMLSASVRRLAAMAMEAHELLAEYSPPHLRTGARSGWDGDAEGFSKWLAAFDAECRRHNLIRLSNVPLELSSMLQDEKAVRPPIRIAGFDRVLPIQQLLFDTWGQWQQIEFEEHSREIHFYRIPDRQTELDACAAWCNREIQTNPETRLLVVAQDVQSRRGEIERAFLGIGTPGSAPQFEFSLGVPLGQVQLVRRAFLLLRWLDSPLDENQLDWLLSNGLVSDAVESADLQAYMYALRQRGLQRTRWDLEAFIHAEQISARFSDPQIPAKTTSAKLPARWVQRMIAALRRLRDFGSRSQSHIEWAERAPQLLDLMGWPGAENSADYQAHRRWQQALDTTGSLGFTGRRIDWKEFLSILERTLNETLFAPQSLDAPIQIAGPAESAGLAADAIWFLGADEDSWPAAAATHPLLPIQVQRDAGMPHSTPQRDWNFSLAITRRLIASAPMVHFSFAAQKGDVETRPSRLIAQLADRPQPLPGAMTPPSARGLATVMYSDSSRVPFPSGSVQGGSSVLTFQSQCPFKAFATARLGARDWDAAEFGLTAAQRGMILHAVLHKIWGDAPPAGLRSRADLLRLDDRERFVAEHVQEVLRNEIPAAIRDQMPRRYLELEEVRLVRLVTEWLDFESERVDFTVAETESERTVDVAGLTLNLRLDRIDRLIDDSLLVIDYKTGDVSQKAWDLPRPDDVQLPIYKIFGLEENGESQSGDRDRQIAATGGLVFAKVRVGKPCFAGRAVDAKETILNSLSNSSSLVRAKLTARDEAEWKAKIERLARDFIEGRADVDPRDYPKTCERCGLQSVCRIQEPENRDRLDLDDDADSEGAEDE
jgi:probable DNA repair protein